MVIQDREDWWNVLNHNWSNILQIFSNVGADLDSTEWNEGYGAEMEAVFHEKTLAATLEDYRTRRDHEAMHTMLQRVWFAAPDRPEIHSWPGWSAVCDLCSENWVFNPEGVA